MSVDGNKAIARRWCDELWGKGNLAVADEIVAPGYVRHDPGDPFAAEGPEDVRRLVRTVRDAVADFHITVEDVIAEGDKVVVRYTAASTDTRGLLGRPPTGKLVHATAIQIFRVAAGQIVESWTNRDDLGMLRQLGVAPEPGQALR